MHNYGFARVAAASPELRVADCEFNAAQIIEVIKQADEEQVEYLVLPELCITGYTCADLFLQPGNDYHVKSGTCGGNAMKALQSRIQQRGLQE